MRARGHDAARPMLLLRAIFGIHGPTTAGCHVDISGLCCQSSCVSVIRAATLCLWAELGTVLVFMAIFSLESMTCADAGAQVNVSGSCCYQIPVVSGS